MSRKLIFMLPLVCLLLASCSNATPTVTIGPSILTSVAMTLTSQYTPEAATATPNPTETATISQATAVNTQGFVFPTATANSCDNAAYIADVTYPDGTSVASSTSITKTWTLKNTGTCTWTATYKIKFVSGSQLSGTTTAIGTTVAPGASINVSVVMTTPSTAGSYTGYWQMANDTGTLFGQIVNITISVSTTPTPTITTTPTITGTPTKSATPTVTPIYIIVTATPMPTNTSVPATAVPPTATPTNTPVPVSPTETLTATSSS